jgi:hypothetical protein
MRHDDNQARRFVNHGAGLHHEKEYQMPIQQQPISGASVYPDPKYLRCAYCDQPVSYTAPTRDKGTTQAQSPQIWCGNKECRAYNYVGQVDVISVPSGQHRGRTPGMGKIS